MADTWKWIGASERHPQRIVWVAGEPLCVSRGGASLQACVLVLLFAASVESQRPRCPACNLWHTVAACETHAPWIGKWPGTAPMAATDVAAAIENGMARIRKNFNEIIWRTDKPCDVAPITAVRTSCTVRLDDGEG